LLEWRGEIEAAQEGVLVDLARNDLVDLEVKKCADFHGPKEGGRGGSGGHQSGYVGLDLEQAKDSVIPLL
jgi:hypothetical protein